MARKIENGAFLAPFFELAASVGAHHILKEIVVRVGVALRAARVFMTKPFGHAIEPSAVVVEPRCACVTKVMNAAFVDAGALDCSRKRPLHVFDRSAPIFDDVWRRGDLLLPPELPE